MSQNELVPFDLIGSSSLISFNGKSSWIGELNSNDTNPVSALCLSVCYKMFFEKYLNKDNFWLFESSVRRDFFSISRICLWSAICGCRVSSVDAEHDGNTHI